MLVINFSFLNQKITGTQGYVVEFLSNSLKENFNKE